MDASQGNDPLIRVRSLHRATVRRPGEEVNPGVHWPQNYFSRKKAQNAQRISSSRRLVASKYDEDGSFSEDGNREIRQPRER
jgi:hypothetical protein